MRRRTRLALIAGGILTGLVLALALVLPSFIDVNRYRGEFETRIGAMLGRDVHLGQMQLRFLPDVVIDVRDLGIGALPSEGEGDLLTAARLRLGVRLLPLLHDKVEITSVRLEKPVLIVDRDASGAFNIERLIAAGPEQESPDSAAGDTTNFAVDSLYITGGTLTIRDSALAPGRTLTLGLEQIDAQVNHLAPDRPVEVNLTTRLAGQPDAQVEIQGSAGPLQPDAGHPFTADLRVELSGLGLEPLGPWCEALTGFSLPPGTLGLIGAARYAGPDDGDLSLESLDIDLGRSHLAATGTVHLASGSIEAGVTAREMEIDPDEVRDLLGGVGVAWPLPPDVVGKAPVTGSGTVRLQLDRSGPRLASLSAKHVKIAGGEINLRRHADGAWNIASLWEADGVSPKATTPPRLEIEGLHVKDTRLRIRDDLTPGAHPVVITDLDITLDSLPVAAPARVRLSAAVDPGGGNPAPIGAEGTIGPVGDDGVVPVNLTVRASHFPVAPLGPYAEPYLAVETTAGMVNLEAKVKGRVPEAFDSSGTIDLDQLVVTLAGPTGSSRPTHLDLGIAFDLTATHGADDVTFRDLTVTTGDESLGMSGRLDRSGGTMRVDATLRPSTISADRIAELLAMFDYDPGFSFSSTRPVQLEGRLTGPLSGPTAPTVTGRLRLDGFTFRHPVMTAPMEKVRATIQVDGEQVSIEDFSGAIGGSDLSGNATLSGFDAPDVRFDLHSRHADFWELMSFVSTDTTTPAAPQARGTDDASALLDAVTAQGKLTIDDGSFQALAFSSLSAGLGLRGQVITLDPLEMDLYGGHFTGNARLDETVTPPRFRIVTTATDVDVSPLLADNLDLGDLLSGRFSGQVSVRGAGTDYDTIVSGLTGDGKVEIRDGRVGQLDVLGILSKASGVFGEQTLQKLSRKIEKEGTEFSRMTGSLELSSGTLRSNDLRLDSPDVTIRGKTSVDLLGATMNGKFKVLLSADLSRSMRQEKSRAAEVFWDSHEERVNVPLALSGPFASPSPNIDWKTATHNLARTKGREALKSRLGKFGALLDRDKGASSAPQASSPQASSGTPTAGITAGDSSRSALTGAGPPSAPRPSSAQAATSGSEAQTTPLPGSGPTPSTARTPAGTPPAMTIEITRTHWSGNFLLKSLVVEGRAVGATIDHLSAQVTDASGRTIQTFDRVEAGPPAPSRSWSFKVSGKKLVGGHSPFTVRIVAHDTAGTTTEITTQVRR
ncbi:MAG: AsmA-like C-terminal region-containing protein [Acidobacteriota bacterium]